MSGRPDVYTHGHHESVLRSHRARTAENSAAYLLPHLRAGMRVLDVGCGPATITRDLVARVAPGGEVVGIDRSAEVVAAAREALGDVPGMTLATGDIHALAFADGSFDVVHAHQVLQHLSEPVAALREMRRVLRSGGILAVRDSDYAGFFWSPPDPVLDRWLALYHAVTTTNGAEADAGRYLPAWVRAAGFCELTVTSSTWTFASPDERRFWGETWAERSRRSAFGTQAVAYRLADTAELDAIAAAWLAWADAPDGILVIPHVEVIARP